MQSELIGACSAQAPFRVVGNVQTQGPLDAARA